MKSLCIVGGCGHVGLPLGLKFADQGLDVTLLDRDARRVAEVLEGQMPFLERGAEELLPKVLASGKLKATTDPSAIADHEAVVITIGTPLDEFLNPHVMSFDEFIDGLLEHVRDGQLLILRSTVYPTVTQRLAVRLKERGLDVDLANCPERIAQGYALDELTRLPQLVGGVTPRANERARELFGILGADCIELAPIESELAKLFANSYRYMNFAISNQFYTVARKFNADFYRIHAAVTKDYPRLAGFAPAGFVGGPCLLKDTMQLAAFNHSDFALGHASMMINEDMPVLLVKFAKEDHDLKSMTAGILGMAFKGNNDDMRDSLSYKLRKILHLEAREVLCTDPYIQDPGFLSLEETIARSDILFLGACHAEYKTLELGGKPLIDCFNFVTAPPAG